LRDASGQRVLTQAVAWMRDNEASPRRRRARADGSYASANDPRVIFGLATHAGPSSVEVHWPDGLREWFRDLSVDRYHRLRRGFGEQVRERIP
jgi:hypothetical protein